MQPNGSGVGVGVVNQTLEEPKMDGRSQSPESKLRKNNSGVKICSESRKMEGLSWCQAGVRVEESGSPGLESEVGDEKKLEITTPHSQ